GVEAGLPDRERFMAGVAKLIRRRVAIAPGDPKDLSIFLLEPTAQACPAALQATRAPMLDNGLTLLAGKVWFVSAAVSSGKCVEVGKTDDDSFISFVT